jgi:hypothetical protein
MCRQSCFLRHANGRKGWRRRSNGARFRARIPMGRTPLVGAARTKSALPCGPAAGRARLSVDVGL